MPKLLTPNLLDVPPTHPTRQEILQAFKTRQGVWTYCGKGMKREEHPWEALLVPSGGEPDDPVSLIAGYCRLLEEAGLLVTGETELDAVQRLCAANEIVPPL
jgi:hypothetical protein